MLDAVTIQLSNLFEHHVGAYVFGQGVKAFPEWFKGKYPGRRLVRLDRMVGNRHGIFCRNAMIQYLMMPYYLAWVHYVTVKAGEGNMLHVRLRPKMVTAEIIAGVRARAIYFHQVHHPLICITKLNKAHTTHVEMCDHLHELFVFAGRMQTEPNFMIQNVYRLFGDQVEVNDAHRKWTRYVTPPLTPTCIH